MKLLAPAGNLESLKAAVFNGADEVYLGINDFNARNNIDGFGLNNLKEAVDFAHVFGVKVCLAINILFSDKELQQALDVIVEAYNMGVDAFIIQDIALAQILSKEFPQIEIHASTQMGLHNLEGVKQVLKYGFKRVVLARETPLSEIKRIKDNCDVEIEYFAQGALCVSFSGNCYLSSYLCDASGNRGKCKQLCRLPYSLLKDGKLLKKGFLLSAKDFNMLDRLKDLEKVGVDVLKIEGRARRPFYVATATREYFNAIHGKVVNKEDIKLAFNRDYACGYFDGNGHIISKYNNHIGIKIGKIDKVFKGKNFNEVYFSSNRKLSAKSTFKTYLNGEEKNVFSAFDLKDVSKGKYKTTTTQNLSEGLDLHLIVDAEAEEKILSFKKKKIVNIEIFAKEGQSIKAIVSIDDKCVTIFGEVCQKAKNQPLTKKDIEETFSKSELFEANILSCDIDLVFITKKALNDFKRKVFDVVFESVTKVERQQLKRKQIQIECKIKEFKDFQIVENLDEDFCQRNIIFSPSEYKMDEIENFVVKCQQLGKKPVLDTPNFALAEDIEILKEIIGKTKVSIVANNYYALAFDTEIIIGGGLNVYNSCAAKIYDKPIIFAEAFDKTKFAYMTLRHCPFKNHLKAYCANCPYTEGYVFEMDSGKKLRIKRKKMSTCTFYLTD